MKDSYFARFINDLVHTKRNKHMLGEKFGCKIYGQTFLSHQTEPKFTDFSSNRWQVRIWGVQPLQDLKMIRSKLESWIKGLQRSRAAWRFARLQQVPRAAVPAGLLKMAQQLRGLARGGRAVGRWLPCQPKLNFD